MRNNWLVCVNKECSIKGGDVITCVSKSEAINIASYVARVLCNTGKFERHIFVVNRVETDATPTIVDKEDLEYRVIYHYSIVCESGLKMILLYDGFCGNQKRIAMQWLDEEGK